jgi:signal transduction histidine kinase
MNYNELEVAIESAPVTVSWISSDLVYLGVNSALAKLMNLDVKQVIGTKLGSYTEQPFIEDFAFRLFNSKENQLSEEVYTIIDDEEKWYHVLGKKYDNGTKATLVGVDISEQKASLRKCQILEKLALIGEMASSLIHEINNPLTTMNLKIQKLQKLSHKNNENFQQAVALLSQELLDTQKRIMSIIKTMRDFSFVDINQSSDSRENINVIEIINKAIDLCQAKIKQHRIKLNYNIQHELSVTVNETEIMQIIVNLITNSIDAITDQQDAWIKIVAYQKNNHILISVVDSGDGIPKHLQEKIMTPFFTTKEKGKGTGIGLGLCQKFAVHHKGSFYIDNTCKNTKFTLKLPKPSAS